MSTTVTRNVTQAAALDTKLLVRMVQESYGPGSWHGPDLKAAVSDVTPELAFWRPGTGRHNIAEIALHHAYSARSVWQQLTGETAKPFLMEGDDWFALPDKATLSWPRILETLATQQSAIEKAIVDIGAGRVTPPKDAKVFDLLLGITCHAVYHAGQIQLIKRLREE